MYVVDFCTLCNHQSSEREELPSSGAHFARRTIRAIDDVVFTTQSRTATVVTKIDTTIKTRTQLFVATTIKWLTTQSKLDPLNKARLLNFGPTTSLGDEQLLAPITV